MPDLSTAVHPLEPDVHNGERIAAAPGRAQLGSGALHELRSVPADTQIEQRARGRVFVEVTAPSLIADASRFSWGKTAWSALWRDGGVVLTVRDYRLSDMDALKLLHDVETTLAAEGLHLKRLMVNGKGVGNSLSGR